MKQAESEKEILEILNKQNHAFIKVGKESDSDFIVVSLNKNKSFFDDFLCVGLLTQSADKITDIRIKQDLLRTVFSMNYQIFYGEDLEIALEQMLSRKELASI